MLVETKEHTTAAGHSKPLRRLLDSSVHCGFHPCSAIPSDVQIYAHAHVALRGDMQYYNEQH